MCPLTMAREGSRVCVVRVAGGCCMAQRLAEMGIIPGASLTVLRADGGAVLIHRGGSCRMAMGREMAGRVFVVQDDAA
ncbi:FeoA family protein [Aminomonas paucivorans]|uniref:FeoA family protein n=1 Tax=Aminomonas paucivorans DSM 12260 TaxID=584708 RepID=E3CZU0_9BACT|nr:FeoA family protein [Aminomonas paucivorans]EFQ24722.1 FeoA family protein [Aminomonas paucivorans DSM 12260]